MEISQKIIDYAIWYYLKYYPSPRKLENKLKEKFGPDSEKGKKYGGINQEEIDIIINEKMSSIIQEEEVIKGKIRSYKNRGKSKIYIKSKLFERLENSELIELFLEEEFQNGELENLIREYEKIKDRFEEKKVIEKLIRKGFSYNDIKLVISENNGV